MTLRELVPQVRAPATARAVPSPIREGIVFDRVTFTYPGMDRPVLRDVSFTLRPGECVALSGVNGAGKSTLVRLLCRLYDPDSGRILVDGVDLRELDPAAWRGQFALLFQDYVKYALTGEQNVLLRDAAGIEDQVRVAAAADRAGVSTDAAAWPAGMRTRLGRWLGGEVEPSLGQWQRLALARAWAREAPVVLLDEPSAALDARAQQTVCDSLRALARDRIALFVTHRPELLAAADRIWVLEDGRIREMNPLAMEKSV